MQLYHFSTPLFHYNLFLFKYYWCSIIFSNNLLLIDLLPKSQRQQEKNTSADTDWIWHIIKICSKAKPLWRSTCPYIFSTVQHNLQDKLKPHDAGILTSAGPSGSTEAETQDARSQLQFTQRKLGWLPLPTAILQYRPYTSLQNLYKILCSYKSYTTWWQKLGNIPDMHLFLM